MAQMQFLKEERVKRYSPTFQKGVFIISVRTSILNEIVLKDLENLPFFYKNIKFSSKPG